MSQPMSAQDERRRLAATFALDVLQGPREPILERIVRLAQREFGMQSAAVVFIDRTTAIFQARVGTSARRCAREGWFCNLTIQGRTPLIVTDALTDSRVTDLPTVAGAPQARSYFGFPLLTREGFAVGTLALFDPEPNQIAGDRIAYGTELAALIMDALALHKIASRDPLTGVLNRRGFMEQYERDVHRSGTERSPLSLVMVDIDYFKSVNDRFGHGVGDDVLRAIALVLEASGDENAVLGRLGGEEFALLLPGSDSARALNTVEMLRHRIGELVFPLAQGLRVSASFGIAELMVHATNDAQLLAQADAALYRAKAEGRNRAVISGLLLDQCG